MESIRAFPALQMGRLVLEFFASIDRRIARTFPRRFNEASIFLIIAHASMNDWATDEGIFVPARVSTGIRSFGIASAMARSPETIRRYVGWLEENGFVERKSTGLSVSNSAAVGEEIASLYRHFHDGFLDLIEGMMTTTDLSEPGGSPKDVPHDELLTRALDLMLLPLEPDMVMPSDLVASAIWCQVSVGCMRTVTRDPVLARAYANRPAPIEMRHPATLGWIASNLQIPYTTVRRKILKLAETGMVAAKDNGWIIPEAVQSHEQTESVFEKVILGLMRRFRELERMGLDSSNIGSHRLTANR